MNVCAECGAIAALHRIGDEACPIITNTDDGGDGLSFDATRRFRDAYDDPYYDFLGAYAGRLKLCDQCARDPLHLCESGKYWLQGTFFARGR